MTKWKQKKVNQVIVTLEGTTSTVNPASGMVGDFVGTIEGPAATFTPRFGIRKAERALEMLFESSGPLSRKGNVPDWLAPWTETRKNADSTVRLRVVVTTATCVDESVFDSKLLHRLSFQRHFHGKSHQTVNWLMANPGKGDTNDGPRNTLGAISERSFCWGHGVVLVTNLFTLRTPSIKALARFDGERNHRDADEVIVDSARGAGGVVLACGNVGRKLTDRYHEVIDLLSRNGIAIYAVAREPDGQPLTTKQGMPIHGLHLPKRVVTVPFTKYS